MKKKLLKYSNLLSLIITNRVITQEIDTMISGIAGPVIKANGNNVMRQYKVLLIELVEIIFFNYKISILIVL